MAASQNKSDFYIYWALQCHRGRDMKAVKTVLKYWSITGIFDTKIWSKTLVGKMIWWPRVINVKNLIWQSTKLKNMFAHLCVLFHLLFRLSKIHGKDYGKPVAGSESERRSKEYQKNVIDEVVSLCYQIKLHGYT